MNPNNPKGATSLYSSSVLKTHGTLLANGLVHAINDGYVAAIYPLLPLVAEEFQAGYGMTSLVKMGLTGALGLFELPAGLIAERAGETLVLGIGATWLALGFAGMGLATAVWQLVGLAVIAGIGGAPQHPLSASLVSRAYSARHRGSAIGTLNFTGDVGKAIVPLVCAWLAVVVGWRQAMLILGLAGLPLVFVFAALSRFVPQSSAHPEASIASSRSGWGILDVNRFASLAVLGILDSAVRAAALTLLPFLLKQKGLDTPTIGALIAVIFVSGALGKFGCGPLGDRFGAVTVVMATELATGLVVLAFIPAEGYMLWVLAALFGFFLNGTSSILYAAVADLVHADRRARGYALYYTLGLLSSAFAPVLYGILADHTSLGTALVLVAIAAALTVPLAPLLPRRGDS
jgi:MFS transporter, FSR family, fosmidomycin resistance protein